MYVSNKGGNKMKKSKVVYNLDDVMDSVECNYAKLREVEAQILNQVYSNSYKADYFEDLRHQAMVLKKSISKQSQLLRDKAGVVITPNWK